MKGRCRFPKAAALLWLRLSSALGLGWSGAGLPGQGSSPPASSVYTSLFSSVLLLIMRCCASAQLFPLLLLGARG